MRPRDKSALAFRQANRKEKLIKIMAGRDTRSPLKQYSKQNSKTQREITRSVDLLRVNRTINKDDPYADSSAFGQQRTATHLKTITQSRKLPPVKDMDMMSNFS